ncbi:hypothetical protein LEP1GSC170_3991 [Leptospira interrogans serovar Bataviae str. HAI135]|nr:hypothetical protein LEP1GSC170_3991 [Leptospira interrogans serovar Bataviae str. HAI135]
MGVLLLNSDHEISSALQKDPSETVTLLIPEDTWLLFPEKDVKLLTKKNSCTFENLWKISFFVGTSREKKRAELCINPVRVN